MTITSLLHLPRELRDQIYDYTLALPDNRTEHALRIERRNVRQFRPTPASILLILRHEYLLLNRQVASEATEVLFKHHTIHFSCGPWVLKTLLTRIEHEHSQMGKQWLRWMKNIELNWTTFPNLRLYPPAEESRKGYWGEEHDEYEIDVDYVRGAQSDSHYDEYDFDGEAYNDNLYAPNDGSLYPSFSQPPDPMDPFGFSTHYPFTDPTHEPVDEAGGTDDIEVRLEKLVEQEVVPLFDYLASPTFALSTITFPLYFIARRTYHHQNITQADTALPLKLWYWIRLAICALRTLLQPGRQGGNSPFDAVRVRYIPWDIWASMDPSDNLAGLVKKGLWNDAHDNHGIGTGWDVFQTIRLGLEATGIDVTKECVTEVRLIRWQGDLDSRRVGDELEISFRRASSH
ncbi:hypothetical protein BU24DRAFT_493655 [Aaosphaeria arxii CBS 175.79]|uniref:F-box domain-containing protein n=1 Tax=Aaosphaeria arxii CBS 175.79 TaxID=1450172 RepID=A0A6A5XK30_9PLEO|nr:uncharacterized protein BU24DRAFT_493655 [Aaosphaeria arxii CBS 175.79]KAF2013110.1 hypothetical protein BU24DRAFT_493655 [Aaosphaeria arxii CBS 175.79]